MGTLWSGATWCWSCLRDFWLWRWPGVRRTPDSPPRRDHASPDQQPLLHECRDLAGTPSAKRANAKVRHRPNAGGGGVSGSGDEVSRPHPAGTEPALDEAKSAPDNVAGQSANSSEGGLPTMGLLHMAAPVLLQFSAGWVRVLQTGQDRTVKAKLSRTSLRAATSVSETDVVLEYSLCPLSRVVSYASQLEWRAATPSTSTTLWHIVFPTLASLGVSRGDVLVLRVRATNQACTKVSVSSGGQLVQLQGARCHAVLTALLQAHRIWFVGFRRHPVRYTCRNASVSACSAEKPAASFAALALELVGGRAEVGATR